MNFFFQSCTSDCRQAERKDARGTASDSTRAAGVGVEGSSGAIARGTEADEVSRIVWPADYDDENDEEEIENGFDGVAQVCADDGRQAPLADDDDQSTEAGTTAQGRILWPPGTEDDEFQDDEEEEQEVEEGVIGMVPWPDYIPRSNPPSEHSGSGEFHVLVTRGQEHAEAVASLHQRRGVRQRALSATRRRNRAVYVGYASDCSTDLDDLASNATFSDIESGDDVESLSEESSVAEKRRLVSL